VRLRRDDHYQVDNYRCHEVFGSIPVSATNGIVINSDITAAPRVRLRNINFIGLGPGIDGIKITGDYVEHHGRYRRLLD
jgi:hypothetical protein